MSIAIDKLYALTHEYPDLPVFVRNVQGDETDEPEENLKAPIWLGIIVAARVGRYSYEFPECTLFDDGDPDIDEILRNLRIALDWEEYRRLTTIGPSEDKTEEDLEEEIREYYESFDWKPAIIADIGMA